MESIKGKNILIIGATGGIGQSCAKLLNSSGANLFLAARNKEKLLLLSEKINLSPNKIFSVDISISEEVEKLKEHFFSQYETIDIIINAAGIGIIKSTEELTEVDFKKTIDYNLLGPFLLMKSLLPKMKELKKGLIINIPGILGKVPMAGAAAYSASKYGLVGMMQSIREEIKKTEIRITNIFLGGVDTPFWDNIDLRVQRDKMVVAEEAAKSIWFLCQQPSSGVVSEMVIQPFNHQAI